MTHCRAALALALALGLIVIAPSYIIPGYTPLQQAHAVARSITLQATFPTWNNTNPTITVTQADSITMRLSNPDGFNHRFVVDVDNTTLTSSPNCSVEKCSPLFSSAISYPFTVDFSIGTYKYYCSVHFNSMIGTFQVNALHDAATTGVSASRNFGYVGVRAALPVKINVTVANFGSGSEATVTVMAKANSSIIGTQTVTNLAASSTKVVTFSWNVTLLAVGHYALSGNATIVGDTNPSNNALTLPTLFQARKTGDVDGNGVVNLDDMLTVAVAWGFTYNPNADILNLGIITLDDVLLVATNWH